MAANSADRRLLLRRKTGGRLRWSIDDGLSARDGWLRDCSRTGMALVVDRSEAPMPGDRIRIIGDDNGHSRQYVVHVRPFDRKTVIVACRSDGR